MAYYVVRLPKRELPTFPDQCILCGVVRPGSTLRYHRCVRRTKRLALRSHSQWVPCCDSCRTRVVRRRRLAGWLTVGLGTIAALIIYETSFFAGTARFLRLLLIKGAVIGSFAPLIRERYRETPELEFATHGEFIEYRFGNPDYKAEFRRLNAPLVVET
ncbi:MAG: hypothetical protein ACKVX7_17305 [Planctomycetota bacterium]